MPLACMMERLTRLDTRMGTRVGETEGSWAWTRQFRGDISTEKQHPSRPDHCYYCLYSHIETIMRAVMDMVIHKENKKEGESGLSTKLNFHIFVIKAEHAEYNTK